MKKNISEIENFSILKKLRSERKITEEFEVMLNNISLEETIALKLELASKLVKGKFVRWLIENNIESVDKFNGFNEEGYEWDGEKFVKNL